MDRTKTVGIIGGGNMGSGIISGIVGSGLLEPKNVIVSDINKKSSREACAIFTKIFYKNT